MKSVFLKIKRKLLLIFENRKKKKFRLPFECLIGISSSTSFTYYFHHDFCYRCVVEVSDTAKLPEKKIIKNVKKDKDKISYEWSDSVFLEKEYGYSLKEVKKQLKKKHLKVKHDLKKYYYGKKIIKNLDLRKSLKIQHKAFGKAQKVSDISLFLQPVNQSFSHLNCALILYEKPNNDLRFYLPYLKEWANDKYAPGAFIIEKKLKELKQEKEIS